jgi:hypothetical protein
MHPHSFDPFNPQGDTTMKASILISAIAACALAAPVATAQDKHDHDKQATSAGTDRSMGQMPDRMRAMQVLMDRIHKTTDPQERRKLMQEHKQSMQANMKAMRGMGGSVTASGAEHSGTATDHGKGGMKGGEMSMMKRHAMMEKRVDMMQMMMEQMMEHDHARESLPAR